MSLSDSWQRLAQRERQLLVAAGAVFALFMGGFFAYSIYDGLSMLVDRNQAMREALAAIDKNREEFMAARALAAQQEGRISRVPLQLVTLIEGAAQEVGIQVESTSDQPPLAHGKKYMQKGVEVKFRQIGLIQLTKFMKKLETGPNLIYVSRLFVKTHFNAHEKLDAELVVSAFEHVPETPKKGKSGAGKPSEKATGEKGPDKT